MNKKQVVVAVIGMTLTGLIYYMKFVMPIARLKQEHPEIFAANAPTAIVGGFSGVLTLLAVLIVTVVVIVKFKDKN